MIQEKLAEKVKPAKEAGPVHIVIPTTKRRAALKKSTESVMEMIEKDLLRIGHN